MRSARMILATAAASAVLALGAPGAYAAGGDWDQDDSSYGKEHGKEHGNDQGKEHGKEHDSDGGHEAPHGGMHTGGGALTAVNDDSGWGSGGDRKQDPDYWKDKDGDSDHGKDSWGEHDKPKGGMHTGGGALAAPTVTAGGVAVLAVAATGLYASRRRKPAGSAA
jgi:hypothetical protein